MVFHTNLFAPLLCVFPQPLNRASRRLKRIGEEEIGYHKPYYFDLKDAVDWKTRF